MDDETKALIAKMDARIGALEAFIKKEVARLDKYDAEVLAETEKYDMQHRNEHNEMWPMIRRAFFKTHPGALNTLLATDKIIGPPRGDNSDPQP